MKKKLFPQGTTGKMKQKTEPERPLGEKISNLLTVDRFGESASQNWPECGAGWLNTQSAGVSWELPLLQLGEGGGGRGGRHWSSPPLSPSPLLTPCVCD